MNEILLTKAIEISRTEEVIEKLEITLVLEETRHGKFPKLLLKLIEVGGENSFEPLKESVVGQMHLHTMPDDLTYVHFYNKLFRVIGLYKDALRKYLETSKVLKDKGEECSKLMLVREFLDEHYLHYTSYLMVDMSIALNDSEELMERVRIRTANCHQSMLISIYDNHEEILNSIINTLKECLLAKCF